MRLLLFLLLLLPSLTHAEETAAERYAARMFAAIDSGDPQKVADLIDFDALLDGARGDVPFASDEQELGFRTGLRKGFTQAGWAFLAIDVSRRGGTITYLGSKTQPEGDWVHFRVLDPEGGLDHISFLLGKGTRGIPVAVDLFPLSAGERTTVLMRRLVLGVIADSNQSVLERLAGKDRLYLDNLETIATMNRGLLGTDLAGGLAAYRRLPKELQEDKLFLLNRVQIAAQISEEELTAAATELARLFPNDPATALQMVDVHFVRGDFDASIAAVEALAANAYPDAYFDVLRGSILSSAGRSAEAIEAARRATAAEPALAEGWGVLMLGLAAQGRFAEMVKVIPDAAKHDVTFDFSLPEFAGFVASKEYAAYEETLRP